MGEQQVFLRRASGLVRSVDTNDVFIYNIGIINLGIGLSTMLLYGGFYHGASWWLSCVIVGVLSVVQTLSYYCFVAIMPRSGSEYLYVSRSLHPALGLAASVSMVVWTLAFAGWSARLFANQGLQSVFADLGTKYHNSTLMSMSNWVAGRGGSFAVAAALVVVVTLVSTLGMKVFLRIQTIVFTIGMLGVLTMIVVLAVSSRTGFVSHFNAAATNIKGANPYATVVAGAQGSGWTKSHGVNLWQTLRFSVWPFLTLAFAIQCASFAGEIKRVDRASLLGMPGAVVVSTIIFVVAILLSQHVMGSDFIKAIGWNSINAPQASTTNVPWVQYLVGLLSGNVVVHLLLTLGFLAWTYFWVAGNIVYGSRQAFAWSLDRLVPAWVGKVSDRFHTPVNVIVLFGCIELAFTAVYCLTSSLNTLTGIYGLVVAFLLVGIGAMVFPYRHNSLFEESVVNQRVLGIPWMVIVGFVTACFMVGTLYLLLTDSLAAGHSRQNLIALSLPVLVGFFGFFIAKAIRKRQGIDVGLAYKEIPVE